MGGLAFARHDKERDEKILVGAGLCACPRQGQVGAG
jgi:hypothetical protein